MFTTLTLSGTPGSGQLVAGAKVTGTSSGATGFVFSTSSTTVNLITVSGSFNTGTSEKIISSSCTASDEIVDDNATAGNGTDLNVTTVVSHSFDKVKQVFMDDPDSGEDFTADTDLNAEFSLSGTVSTTSGTTVTGFGTKFLTEVRAGDVD